MVDEKRPSVWAMRREIRQARKAQGAPGLVRRRPAETATGAAGLVVFIVSRLFGISDEQILSALALLVGMLPAGISWLVDTVGLIRERDAEV